MSKSKTNRRTIVLSTLLIAAMIGVCFFCVALYAKKEINKPKFIMPEQPAQTPLTELLTDKNEAFAYAVQKYSDTIASDDTEGSWSTQARFDGEWQTPFSEADEAILLYIRDHAGGQLSSFYPRVSGVRMTEAQDIPALNVQAQNIVDFSVTGDRIENRDRYFLTLTFDPENEDTQAMPESAVFRKISDELSPVAELSDTRIKAGQITVRFEIGDFNEQLLSVEIDRDYRIDTAFRLTDDSAALLPQREGRITLPYATTQTISFIHYGAHFTERAIAVKPGDIKVLPAAVTVKEHASKADYTLTFTSSEPHALSFDEDGVMTVGKEAPDDPVTVTVTLDYNGHVYTDRLTVFITEWEVATDVGA